MFLKRKYNSNLINILISSITIIIFCYIIIISNNFYFGDKKSISNAVFLVEKEFATNGYIEMNNVEISDDFDGEKFTYVVQDGDTLSAIAYKFGTTVSNVKKINGLAKDSIKVGQKLTITQESGILYEIKNDTNLNDFVKKYKLNIDEIMAINYFSDENTFLTKGDEIFIPIDIKKAQEVGLIAPTPKPTPKPGKIKPKNKDDYAPQYTYIKGKDVLSKRYYNPKVKNGFYAGHCTRYVAIKKFPKGQKLWSGNGNQWYANAKAAGYSVGSSPQVGSIIVIRYGGGGYYSAGHVGIVKDIDWDNKKVLIEEMNAFGRFIVTLRWIPMDKKIIGYIYL